MCACPDLRHPYGLQLWPIRAPVLEGVDDQVQELTWVLLPIITGGCDVGDRGQTGALLLLDLRWTTSRKEPGKFAKAVAAQTSTDLSKAVQEWLQQSNDDVKPAEAEFTVEYIWHLSQI